MVKRFVVDPQKSVMKKYAAGLLCPGSVDLVTQPALPPQ